MHDYDACLSAVPYWFNVELTRAAIAAGTHFCDLGGNNTVVGEQIRMDAEAQEAGVTVVPDCGLAPGMANVLAAHAMRKLDETTALRIRVGGLPLHPRPPLDYQLVFAVEGLINEYVERCIVIRDGVKLSVEPLTEIESLEFPEPFGTLEAFHTSGGLSTLARTFAGKVRDMDYKTIRYPGHGLRMRTLLDLGLFETTPVALDGVDVQPRALTAQLLRQRLTGDGPDVVLVRVTAIGMKNGGRRRIEYEIIDHCDPNHGITAMMRCTAYPASIILQMLGSKQIEPRGVIVQERCVPAEAFIAELAKRDIQIDERQS
jgi:lysine 6-dehydrogenase